MKSIKSILRGTIVLSILVLVAIIPLSTAMADTEGPNNPVSGTNETGIGTETWVHPGNITNPDSPYATVTLYHGHRYSNYLQGTQYGFAIPTDATITGIQVNINRRSSAHNPNIIDNEVRLVKAGAIGGDNKAITAAAWPTVLTMATYGGATDLWGTVWTPSDINSPDFGVVLATVRDNNGNNSRQAVVDSMQITVYYEFTTMTTVDCGDGTPITYGNSITCVATVSRSSGDLTPSGTVTWTTDDNGSFDPNPCDLNGADGVSTCLATYTPNAVGSGSHLLTATYNGDAYFSSGNASQTVTVVSRPVTVSADPQFKVYGNPDPQLTYQITEGSLVFYDTFTGTLSREPGEDVGSYAILQGSLALPIDYDMTYVGDFLSITKADPICEVAAYAVPYDGNAHTATGTCMGVMSEDLTGLDLSGTIHLDAGVYTDTWTYVDETGSYNDVNGKINDEITPRAITIVADAKSKPYGQVDPGLTYQITVGSLLTGDTLSGGLTRQAGESVGTYAILQGTLSLPAYYEINYVGANFTIIGARYLFPLMLSLSNLH